MTISTDKGIAIISRSRPSLRKANNPRPSLLKCSLILICIALYFAIQVIYVRFGGLLSVIRNFYSVDLVADRERGQEEIFTFASMSNNIEIDNNTDDSSSPLPLCTREQIRKGHWQAVQRPNGPSYLAKLDWEQTCWKKEQETIQNTAGYVHEEYEWVVPEEKCIFRQFDADRLCEILGNRTIAFFGDSITFQQYNSLAYMTNAKDVIRFSSKCFSQVCGNTTYARLYWLRDNQATAERWKTMMRNMKPEIVVLNRGAHFSPTPEVLNELNDTLHSALEWQQDCDSNQKDCVLMWRTTAPGYPDCQRVGPSGPITSVAQAETAIGNQTWYEQEEFRQQFHWWEFKEQNQQVEEFIQTFITQNGLMISFIDFYEMAILRPDHHISEKDCLHWCLPGPMDAANTLLLHELEVAQQKKLGGNR